MLPTVGILKFDSALLFIVVHNLEISIDKVLARFRGAARASRVTRARRPAAAHLPARKPLACRAPRAGRRELRLAAPLPTHPRLGPFIPRQ